MSTPTFPAQQFADLGRRGQEAAVEATRTAGDALRTYVDAVTPRGPRVDPQAVATAGYELAERLLHVQRDYVLTTVALLTEAGETVTAQASAAGETLKSRTEEAAERVVDFATETTRRAATAARNGVSV